MEILSTLGLWPWSGKEPDEVDEGVAEVVLNLQGDGLQSASSSIPSFRDVQTRSVSVVFPIRTNIGRPVPLFRFLERSDKIRTARASR